MKQLLKIAIFTAAILLPIFAQANDKYSPYLRFGIGGNYVVPSTKKGNIRDTLGHRIDVTDKGSSPFYSAAFGVDIEEGSYSFDLEYINIPQINFEAGGDYLTSFSTSLYMLNATHNLEDMPLFFGIGIGLSNLSRYKNSKVAFAPHIGINLDKNFFIRGSWIFTRVSPKDFVDDLDLNLLTLQLGIKFNI